MAARSLSLQDHFLNSVRRAKLPVTIFLVKGVKLQGVVTWFDAFSLLLRREGASQLVYKHSISTIMPAEAAARLRADRRRGRWQQRRRFQDLFLAAAAREKERMTLVPRQRRDAPGLGHWLRPVQRRSRARRAGAAGLQACDFDACSRRIRSTSAPDAATEEEGES